MDAGKRTELVRSTELIKLKIITMRIKFSILLMCFIGQLYGQILPVQDTREQATSPDSYAHSFEAHLKFGRALGLSEAGMNPFYSILGLRGWSSDNTGGKAHELAFSNDNKIYFRSGYSPAWDHWRQIVIADGDGNVGIGTTSPSEKLSVNGKIRAREVRVEVNGWADHVFDEDYQVVSLADLEKFIKENKHLPEIPTAAEVKSKGVDLGEMNVRLLKKIEELTLHLIELDKRIVAQDEKHQREIKLLTSQNKS